MADILNHPSKDNPLDSEEWNFPEAIVSIKMKEGKALTLATSVWLLQSTISLIMKESWE